MHGLVEMSNWGVHNDNVSKLLFQRKPVYGIQGCLLVKGVVEVWES